MHGGRVIYISLWSNFTCHKCTSLLNFNQNACILWRIYDYKYPKSQDFFAGDAIFLSSKLIQNGTTSLDFSYYCNVSYPFPLFRFLTAAESPSPRSQMGASIVDTPLKSWLCSPVYRLFFKSWFQSY